MKSGIQVLTTMRTECGVTWEGWGWSKDSTGHSESWQSHCGTQGAFVKLDTELSVCMPPVFMSFPVPWEQRSDPLQRSQAFVIYQGGQQ